MSSVHSIWGSRLFLGLVLALVAACEPPVVDGAARFACRTDDDCAGQRGADGAPLTCISGLCGGRSSLGTDGDDVLTDVDAFEDASSDGPADDVDARVIGPGQDTGADGDASAAKDVLDDANVEDLDSAHPGDVADEGGADRGDIQDPIDLTEPDDIIGPEEVTEPTEVTGPADVTEPEDLTEPVDVTEPADATEPGDATEPDDTQVPIDVGPECVLAADCAPVLETCKVADCVDGLCTAVFDDGASCDDGDACTTGDSCVLASGVCAGILTVCSDGLACTTDQCDAGSGECVAAVTSGFCVIDGSCVEGGQTKAADPCLVCEPSTSTQSWSAQSCNDGDPCTTDACTPGQGCTAAPLPAESACDDGDPASDDDVCLGGVCVGVRVCLDDADCTSGRACHEGTCGWVRCEPTGVLCPVGIGLCEADKGCADPSGELAYVPSGVYGVSTSYTDSPALTRSVRITSGYWVARREETLGQWQALHPEALGDCADCPLGTVNWYDAVTYANERSLAEGRTPCYALTGCEGVRRTGGYSCASVSLAVVGCDGYRLPTEVEWETAARAGEPGALPNGGVITAVDYQCHPEPDLEPIAWYCNNTPAGSSPPIGCQLEPNAWGLCDVLGSMLEWAADGIEAPSDYPMVLEDDYAGLAVSSARATRGSCFSCVPRITYLGFRGVQTATVAYPEHGIRLVRNAVEACRAPGCEGSSSGALGGACDASAPRIGRKEALLGTQVSGDTAAGGQNYDNLPSTAQECIDDGRDESWRIWLEHGERLQLALSADDWDAMIKVYPDGACEGTPVCLYDPAASFYEVQATSTGWHTIVVDGRSAFADRGPYTLEVALTAGPRGECCVDPSP